MEFEYGFVWIHVLSCMRLVKFRMEKYRSLYNSMGLSSFGYRKYKYTVWRLPNSFLVRVELRRVLRLL